MTGLEKAIDEPIIFIFLKNLWNAITMFFYKNGVVWVNSIPNRPALGVISAVFYFIGSTFLFKKWMESKNWKYISLIASIPILLLPSILSLAYPGENPALNRSAGAVIPVFLLTGHGLHSIIRTFFVDAMLSQQSPRLCRYATRGLLVS